ncbi:unnamed protein product [Orchesella dallaii]|uniref:CCHC-type domain-containing protein n=1 Tax=Orchesella dallaii TaxID=48710 RepID=A0ABP1QMJ5_9HEXA
MHALLDTGASHSFISMHVATRLNACFQSDPTPLVTIGNTAKIKPVGICTLSFQFMNKEFTWRFLVMKELPFNIIFGSDFIIHSKLVLDIANGKFYVADRPHKRISFSNSDVLCALQGLTLEQKSQLDNLIAEFPQVFSDTIGTTDLVECELQMEGPPIAQRPFKQSPTKQAMIKEHVDKILSQPTAMPIVATDEHDSENESVSPELLEDMILLQMENISSFCKNVLAKYGVPIIAYKQLPGEHIQEFALRIHNSMCEVRGVKEIPDEQLFPKVFQGLHPSMKKLLPLPEPRTLGQIFYWYDDIISTVPPTDVFWCTAFPEQPREPEPSPKVAEEVISPTNNGVCYKCGSTGHFAYQCESARNRLVQPKRKNRRRRKAVKRLNTGFEGGLCKVVPSIRKM